MKIVLRTPGRAAPDKGQAPAEPEAPPALPPRPAAGRSERPIDLTRLRIFRNEVVIISGFLLLLALLVMNTAFGLLAGVFERLAVGLS